MSETITKRRLQVFKLLAAGESYAKIAEKLEISPETVKTHAQQIYRVMGVSNRAEAITKVYNLDHSLLTLETINKTICQQNLKSS